MEQIWSAILVNLQGIGVGAALFAGAYFSNMAFALWTNIKMKGQAFEWRRVLDSLLKILAFGGGLVLLCAVVTTLPLFADAVGWTIPEAYKEIFANLVIIAVFLLAACKYAMEAFGKMKHILFPEK